MRLEEILHALRAEGLEPELTGDANIDFDIDQLTADSRMVRPNGLFVATRGESADGHLFIDKAVNNGAIAIVHEAMPGGHTLVESVSPGIASVRVTNSKVALGIIAAVICDLPSSAVACVGVTGTNGKTTTSFLLYQLFESVGLKSGLIGTIEYRAGRKFIEATHTTPDAIALQRLLSEMRSAGCKYCSMEVSSHAL
ncbi:MAG: UDP-N-acetylmuramoyl-L-alanyl-D-glutamate--2,6-diaminopimelate ligase, partial [Rhodothermales bacterium]|nr:UDP-N-acetylmuramoyl-L-alanyl-D-glutamate--2,6-diaminopimelate ligase [Rhodothermales bacterium]